MSVPTGNVEMGASEPNIPVPSPSGDFINPLLLDTAHYQLNMNFSADKPPLSNWGSTDDLKIEAWRQNDGAVSSISQRYPFTAGNAAWAEVESTDLASIEKGKWHFQRVETIIQRSFDHFDPVCGYLFKPHVRPAHRLLHQKVNEILL
jgi:triacylglycerol lipase